MVTFVVVPQWQGSGASRRTQLPHGTAAIRAELPAAAICDIAVPGDAGDPERSGVHGHGVLAAICAEQARALAELAGPAVTIGGDCGVELAAIPHATRRTGGDLAVVWFDAHGDLNTPATSPSGAFHGMVLRAVLGDGAPGLVSDGASRPRPGQIVLAGARAFDPAERDYIAAQGIRVIPPDAVDPDHLIDAVRATGARSVYLHVDVDVLDPGELRGLSCPEPHGVRADALIAAIAAVGARFPLAGAGLTELTPWSSDADAGDLATIRRILAALTG